MSIGKQIAGVIISIIIITLISMAGKLTETVEKGTYDILQIPVSGKIVAEMKPGMYAQLCGDVTTWPKSDTFFFTADSSEGKATDQSIEVRFVDGSMAKISGTMRVQLPTNKDQAKALMTDLNFSGYPDLENRFVLPIVRKALRNTANMMTAQQSYAAKRADFSTWAEDQILLGLYKTKTVMKPIMVNGKEVMKPFKERFMTKGTSDYAREKSPLGSTGIGFAQFEIKSFKYEDKVKKQISAQQESLMAIATKKAEAEKAKQEAITVEAKGKAELQRVKYEKLKEKTVAVIEAEKNAKVATTDAQRDLDVAKLDKLAAVETKAKDILLGQGIAKRKQLIMAADGALKQKLQATVEINEVWAKAFANRKVPTTYFAGGGKDGGSGPDNSFQNFMNAMTANATSQLSLDMKVK